VSQRHVENTSEAKLLSVLSVSECRRAAHAFPRRCIQTKISCGPNSLFFPAVREFRTAQMETKDMSFDMRAMSGQSGGVVRVQRRVAGLARALVCRSVVPLPNKDQAKTGEITGEITGGITGKRTGEKALFRNVKRLNHMESFLPKMLREKIAKKTMRLPQRKGLHACRSNTGNSAGRKSPDPKAQVIESAADFGMKNFSHMNPPSGRESLGTGRANGCAATISDASSKLLRADFCFGGGRTLELGGAGAKPALT
jgi:hypothetical protein